MGVCLSVFFGHAGQGHKSDTVAPLVDTDFELGPGFPSQQPVSQGGRRGKKDEGIL